MRSDQTAFCTACEVRFARAWLSSEEPEPRCPACGGEKVVQLSDVIALHELSRAQVARGRRWFLAGGGLAFLAGLTICLATVHLLMPVAFVGVLMMVFSPGVGAWAAIRAEKGRELRLLAPPAAHPRAPRQIARGVVRAARPTSSPLGAPCAAFRLYGRTSDGPIDDTGGTCFSIERRDSPDVHVELGEATIELPRSARPRKVDASGALAVYLAARGIGAYARRAKLAEVVLRDGDEVEVEGTPDLEPAPGGYRDSAQRLVFRDRPGSPLVIRRPRR